MKGLALITWIAALSFAFILISVAGRAMGPYYCVQEGFFPRALETDYFAYDTVVRATKKDLDDKRLFGNFTVKKRMKKIGAVAEMFKESNKNWNKFGLTYTCENLCEIDMHHFENAFSGKLNKDDCSMDVGEYYLDGYNIEKDIKTHTDKMFYGHWRIILYLRAEIEGKMVDVNTLTYQVHILDEDTKKQQQSGSSKSNRQKGKKNQ